MAKFLTPGWTEQVLEALNASDDVRRAISDTDLCVQQVVTGAPDGEVSYWTKFSGGEVTGAIGEADDADVTIAQDYDTAVALNRGEMNAQAAFMQGKLKVTGNMGKLLQNQAAMGALAPVLSTIETEY